MYLKDFLHIFKQAKQVCSVVKNGFCSTNCGGICIKKPFQYFIGTLKKNLKQFYVWTPWVEIAELLNTNLMK